MKVCYFFPPSTNCISSLHGTLYTVNNNICHKLKVLAKLEIHRKLIRNKLKEDFKPSHTFIIMNICTHSTKNVQTIP